MNSIVLKIAVIVLALQVSFSAHAGNSPLAKQISMNLNFPQTLVSNKIENTQVRVSFKLTEKGEKEILVVNGPTEELKQYVVKAIMNTKFSGVTECNKEYNVVFNFKQI